MKLTPEELTRNGYVLLDKLEHKDLIPFVKVYLKKHTPISVFYKFSNVAIMGLIIVWFCKSYNTNTFNLSKNLAYFLYGFALAFTLIPIHEYIHVLAYKALGAANTSCDVNWKKFYFLAIADKFVANKREFQIVALAPFVVISVTLILLLFFTNQLWTFAIIATLLTHTAFSSGDFGMISYFYHQNDKDVITYDDKENSVSYFYGKAKQMV
jgi:hypothetical protein